MRDFIDLKRKKNIIFDLGNVVIDIDYNISKQAFIELGFKDKKVYSDIDKKDGIFAAFEKGEITEDEFLSFLKSKFPSSVTKEDILNAWNALILDYKEDRILKILSLRKEHKVYLLSNTNISHISKCSNNVPIVKNLNNLFDRVFYSYQMGVSKPDSKIFKMLINETKINPLETLFLDDSICNVNTAKSLGITSLLIKDPNKWVSLLS